MGSCEYECVLSLPFRIEKCDAAWTLSFLAVTKTWIYKVSWT